MELTFGAGRGRFGSAGAVAVLAGTFALLTGGCFDPEFPDGKVSCQVSADCPPGLVCSGGLCFHLEEDGAIVPGVGTAGTSGHGGGVGGVGGGSAAGYDGGVVAGRGGGGDAGRGGSGGGGRDAGDASVGDGDCTANLCAAGDHRCGPSGLDTCVAVGNCMTWSADVACTGRKTCQGNAPSAACECPAKPSGCTGAGNACVGGALVTCAVDGDSCTYQSATVSCPTSEPCGGAFPNAVCTCPAKPTVCTSGQPGTFCDSTGKAIVTCTLDTNKCLVAAAPVSCAQPCTGTAGSVTCGSCPAPPTECTSAGTLCDASGRLETCGSDPSTGCLTKTDVEPCGSPQTCQGALPSAACVCPSAPSVCMGQTGTVCSSAGSSMVLTCAKVNGCLTATPSKTCPSPQTCTGSLPSATCACPNVAACQSGSSGSYCDTTSGDLVTCTQDINLCFSSGTAPCPTGQVCSGSFPNGACACPSVPNCPNTGVSCSNGTTLRTCTKDTQGCFHEADTNCATTGLVCSLTGTVAGCNCPAPTNGCGSATGKSCNGDTTVLTCTASTPGGCIQGATSSCATGQYCWTSMNSCAVPVAVGYPTDLGNAASFGSGYLTGEPVTITGQFTLRSFGMIANTASMGISMGLYTDVGGSPSALVAKAEFQSVVLASPNKNEYPAMPPAAGGSLVIPGGTYWIMAVYQAPTSVRIGPASGTTLSYAITNTGWAALPSPLTGVSPLPNEHPANYYILITQ